MAIKALNPFTPFWYTPMAEQGVDNPTRFQIRGLDGTQQGYMQPELTVDRATRMVTGLSGRGLELALQYGLLGWENFSKDEGPVSFTPRNFALIDIALRTELAMTILGSSYVKPAEKKT